MSDPRLSRIPVAIVQAYIGSLVETAIIQSFFTGLYALLYFQAIAKLVKQKSWKALTVMTSLFITVVLNLAAVWDILYQDFVIHNATRETIAETILIGPAALNEKLAYATLALSVLMADSILVWKSYILWNKSKIIGVLYSVIFLAELVSLPIYLVRNITLGGRLGFMDLYMTVSFIATIVATFLIIYKIVSVSKQGNNQISTFQYIIKVLVESGVLYITVIVICSILHILKVLGINSLAVIHATQDFDAILVPVTGIAPTLIVARIEASRKNQARREQDIEANRNNSDAFLSHAIEFRRDHSNVVSSVSNLEESDAARNSGRNIQTRTI